MSAPTMQRPTNQQRPAAPEQPAPGFFDEVLEKTVANIEKESSRYCDELAKPLSEMRRALVLGRAIATLMGLLTDKIMAEIMPLMNTPIGFKTDRPSKTQPTPYSVHEVRQVLVVSLLKGFSWVGNEINIIASQFYGTQAGYERKFREIEGISDVDIAPGVPAVHNGQMCCRVALRWKLNGTRRELVGPDEKPGMPFGIISYQGSTPDAIVGKAKRKAWKAAYELVTGSRQTEPDDSQELTPAAEASAAISPPPAVEDPSIQPAPPVEDSEDSRVRQEFIDNTREAIAAAKSTGDTNAVYKAIDSRREWLGKEPTDTLLGELRAKVATFNEAPTGKRSRAQQPTFDAP